MAETKPSAQDNIFDLREHALRRLPKGCSNSSTAELKTKSRCAQPRGVRPLQFKPRTLVDVSGRSPEITLIGQKQEMPDRVAPTGTTGSTWYERRDRTCPRGRGGRVPFTLATGSMTAIERSPRRPADTLDPILYVARRVDVA